jgi:uncharacterized repeat protein (TIGR03843 family)
VRVDDPAAVELLRTGQIEIRGRLVDASNATLFCELTGADLRVDCVYKPIRGERPLWDFPDGTLADREVAAHLISRACGVDLIPPTALRDGPFGPGMVQLWVDTDDNEPLISVLAPGEVPAGWCAVVRAHDRHGAPAVLAHADTTSMRLLAVLDLVLNNADRKAGHVLNTTTGLYGIDHGVSLHVEDKLRTVLWGFLGQPFTETELTPLRRLTEALTGGLADTLAAHLLDKEITALGDRTARLLEHPRFPEPGGDWPPIPWPVF